MSPDTSDGYRAPFVTGWSDPATPTGSDAETEPIHRDPRRFYEDGFERAANVAKHRIVIFQTNDAPDFHWAVFVPYSWPGIGEFEWHTASLGTYAEALTWARVALELAALKKAAA